MKYLLASILFLFVFVPHVFAQAEDWVISTFQSEINVLEAGDVDVSETLDVDYGNLSKHGIFRDIPYVYDQKGEKYYTDVIVESVLRDGNSEPFEVIKNDYNLRIKIGDAGKTISGPHTYSIRYSVQGVILPYENYDELYWDITGSWPVPIENVRAIVSVPSDAILQAACYQGSYGVTDTCDFTSTTSNALFSARGLNPYDEVTVAVGFKKGTVPIISVARPKTFFEQVIEPGNMGIFAVTAILGVGGSIWLWFKKGRDSFLRGKHLFDPRAKEEVMPLGMHETIVVEYTPPEKLRPAELGVLMDERADTLDVTATIIDLASRGYFRITEIPKKWMFGKIDYQLDLLNKDTKGLLSYEKLLVDELFDGKNTIKTSELKNKFYSDLAKVKKELYAHVVEKKLFPSSPESARNEYMILAITAFSLSVFGMIFLQIVPVQMFTSGILLSSVILFIFSRSMSKRTAHGRELYRRSKGYYEFISHVEKYRQQFFERKNMLNEVLPYAIVFGLTGKFAQALKDMGIEPAQPSWYVGTHAFNVANLEKSVSTFSSSLSTAISSAPRSSGSSGGGFSGGGFGGGGGGSW